MIIKNIDLKFKGIKYKVNHELVESKLTESLSVRDFEIIDGRNINNYVASVFFTEGSVEVVPVSITEANNLTNLTALNVQRNIGDTTQAIESPGGVLIEKTPVHYHISELLDTLKNMSGEYDLKDSMVAYFADNFYDPDFATGMWRYGRGYQVTPSNNRLETNKSGFIKVENANNSAIQLYVVIRGIPLAMRKTKTSNQAYAFIYPEYLFDNKEQIDSIQYILVENAGTAQFYYGTDKNFLQTSTYTTLDPLNIINRDQRNIT